MEEFKKQYKRLNKLQREAVDTIEGPVMVIAGPGTGKTTILTLRIANILQKTDTPANGILALTFTDSGVKAMKRKLREIIGSRADEIRIYTYHGFAASIINEFDDHFPHLSRAKQITDIEQEVIIRDILKSKKFAPLRPIGDPELYVGKIIKAISDSKKEAWTPEMVESFAKKEIKNIENDEGAISTRGASKGELKAEAKSRIKKCERTILFAEVYKEYEAEKRKEKLIDFDDLVFEFLHALKTDELLLRLIQEKYLYILVDEHQDTNDSQNLLIQAIADFFEAPNLFVVGDEKQAIYRFQGASVENFMRFQNVWQEMKVIKLKDNYRSHQSILDASFGMIENNYEENEHATLRVRLLSGLASEPKPIEIIEAPNSEAMEERLVNDVKMALKGPKTTIAVIVRTNREVELIREIFEDNGVSASTERGADIFSHPLGKMFFDLVDFIDSPNHIESLASTVAGGLWHLDFGKRTKLIAKIRSGNLDDIEKEIPDLKTLEKSLANTGPVAFLVLMGTMSGVVDLALRNPVSAEVWRAIINLATDLARKKSITNPKDLIAELLSYKTSAENKIIKISSGQSDARVSIMTAHGSKGLEFDYVFLPYATEESWMPKNRGTSFVLPREKGEGDEIKDARRLFYVALTRARVHASIMFSLEEGSGRLLSPLRFIEELDRDHIKRVSIKPVKILPKANEILNADERDAREVIDFAKNIILDSGLSVTALNHFIECPSKFIYKSVLKLPEAPSGSAEKGNAMHEAMANVWKAKNRDEANIRKIIESTVTDYFKKSLLEKFEKEQIVESLIEDAPVVAKAMVGHFALSEKALVENWQETTLSVLFNKEKIDVKLHGKLDAVVESKDTVMIFDYKTRESMSTNEIKGETKNSTGDYFRQLIFYKLLVSGKSGFEHKKIEPALVFIKPDSKGRCQTLSVPILDEDIEKLKKNIEDLVKTIWSGKVIETNCDDKRCEYCSLKKLTFGSR